MNVNGGKFSFKKTVLFGSIIVVFSILLAFAGILVLDLYMHYRLSGQQGYNYRGYRGEVLASKKSGEYRVGCFGGSTTYGYGVPQGESWPALLDRLLSGNKMRVQNFGMNTQGIYGISHDVKYYAGQEYDLAIIYEGYNDSSPNKFNTSNFRGHNVIFRYFGYMPILGTYLSEKTMILKYGIENLNNAYSGKVDDETARKEHPVKFQLGLTMGKLSDLMKRVNNKLNESNLMAEESIRKGENPFVPYIAYLTKTFDWLISHDKKIIYACQPGLYNSVQQRLVRDLIKRKFADKVLYVNLSDAVDLSDEKLCFDGVHLTAAGNAVIARSLLPVVQNAFLSLKTGEPQ